MRVWKKPFIIQKEEPPLKIIDNIKKTIGDASRYLAAFAKWTVISLFIGILGGSVGSLFHISIDAATEYRGEHTLLIFLLPVGALIITLLYRLCKRFGKLGTDRVLEALKTDSNLPAIMAPLIFVSTVITHFFGGSAGREGAALQLGGSMGYTVGKLIKLNSSDRHIIVMTGMSAVFASLFGTPLTAAIFAIEVTFVGMSCYAALLPCTISAICGAKVAAAFGISPVAFGSDVTYKTTPGLLVRSAVLAFLCAIISIVFCYTIRYFSKGSKKLIPNPYIRAAAGGAIVAILSLAVGCYDYNGAGMDIISDALQGNCVPYAFVLKLVFTAVTIAAGFKGGEIVPAFFVGSTFGCTVGPLLGLDAPLAAQIGFVALFCGVVNCPVASLILALEVFGAENIPIFALICSISYMMSGKTGLYKSQTIVYSKISDDLSDFEVVHDRHETPT